MNSLDFTYNEKTIRTMTNNNEVWFVGVDICRILDYADTEQALKKLDEDERYLNRVKDGSGQLRKTWMVNESGLYSLILTSNKPEAKAFKRWITHEVLPSIRKAGKYTTEAEKIKALEIQKITKTIDETFTRIKATKSALNELKGRQNKNYVELFEKLKEDCVQQQIKFPKEETLEIARQ